jgi:hypothetical protein
LEYANEDGDAGSKRHVSNVSPYLREEGDDIAVRSVSRPLNAPALCCYGSKPTDGGNLIIEDIDLKEFLSQNPDAKKYIRPLLCADEYLYNLKRWCLWLVDAPASDIRTISGIRARVDRVRAFRQASKKPATKADASIASLFAEIRHHNAPSLVVPQHTSENREYVPFGYFSANFIIHNSCSFIPNAGKYLFGIVSSTMHMAWVKVVAGRLESRYRYSTRLVYNNYPWPAEATAAQQRAVEEAAERVLDARTAHPDQTLADLYDPLAMPRDLRDAHRALDRAVDRCYRSSPFTSDRQRVEYLFGLYESLTSPLIAPEKSKSRRRKKL